MNGVTTLESVLKCSNDYLLWVHCGKGVLQARFGAVPWHLVTGFPE